MKSVGGRMSGHVEDLPAWNSNCNTVAAAVAAVDDDTESEMFRTAAAVDMAKIAGCRRCDSSSDRS